MFTAGEDKRMTFTSRLFLMARSGASSRLVANTGMFSWEKTPGRHVEVRSKYDSVLHFWIAVDQPERVIKHSYGRDVVLSSYDDAARGPTLSTQVTLIDSRFTKRIVQS